MTEPLSQGFNAAVMTIANRLFPLGWDVAPTQYRVTATYAGDADDVIVCDSEAAARELESSIYDSGTDVICVLIEPIEAAPSSLAELNEHIRQTGRILVSGDASDSTIYGDREHNYAFRAWHDWTHWRHQAEFTDAGERLVCAAQKGDLLKCGFGTKWHALVDAEVVGQLEYKARYGEFPRDQRAFTEGYLAARNRTGLLAFTTGYLKEHYAPNQVTEYARGHVIGARAR